VLGVLAEPALLLSSYMLVFGAKPPTEKVGSDRISRRINGVDLVSAVLRFRRQTERNARKKIRPPAEQSERSEEVSAAESASLRAAAHGAR
jgi:hypothetical protein